MTPADAQIVDWAIVDIEPMLADLRGALGIMGHLIHSPSQVDPSEWTVILDKADQCIDRLDAFWHRAWDQHHDAQEAHRGEMETLAAKKAAPGSPDDLKAADALRRLLLGAAQVVIEQCEQLQRPKPERNARGFGD